MKNLWGKLAVILIMGTALSVVEGCDNKELKKVSETKNITVQEAKTNSKISEYPNIAYKYRVSTSSFYTNLSDNILN